MFAIPPLLALLFIDYLKPQEFIPVLASLPLLYLFTALALLGFVIDVRIGLSRLAATPQLPWVILFVVWALITVAINAPATFAARAIFLFIPVSLYLLVGHAVQSFRMLQVVIGVLLAICLFLAAIGVHQGLAPWGCHQITFLHGDGIYTYDGRECSDENRVICDAEQAEPGADYMCEHVGLFNTHSDHGRVRYRGALADPNELALALGIAVPFAFAFVDRKRSRSRELVLILTLGLVGVCAVFTQSRGGQIVFLAVLGVYFLQRYGVRGLLFGTILALPLLLLGGRSGADAESSTIERTECWYEGMLMFWHQPLFGVGSGQFTEHHYLTAHNSYVLSSAELGLPGMWIWTSIMYLSTKIPVKLLWQRRLTGVEPPPVARTWSLAFLAAMTGMIVGVFFLSYCYKEIFWIYVGLTGALYLAIKRHQPTFEVKLTARDAGIVLAIDVVLVLFISVYTRWKVG